MKLHRFFLLSLLAGALAPTAHGQEKQTQDKVNHDTGGVDPKVIVAWEKIGAEFCWISRDAFGLGSFSWARPLDPGAIPGFRVKEVLPKGYSGPRKLDHRLSYTGEPGKG